MDNSVLRKKLNTFKSAKGKLSRVSDEVVMEVLRAWEEWPGTTADLYRELGLSKMQLVTMIQKAKRLVKKGVISESEFKEIKMVSSSAADFGSCNGAITMKWAEGKVIKFSEVDQLVDFLKKVS